MRALLAAALFSLIVPALAAEPGQAATEKEGPCFYDVEPGTGEPGAHPGSEEEYFIPLLPAIIIDTVTGGVSLTLAVANQGAASVLDLINEPWYGLYIREDPHSCTGDDL